MLHFYPQKNMLPDHDCRQRLQVGTLLYSSFSTLLVLMMGAERTPELHLGYWVFWNTLGALVLVLPYVTNYQVVPVHVSPDGVAHNDYVLQYGAWTSWSIYLLQLLAALAAVLVNGALFVYILVQLLAHCDSGSNCDAQITSYMVILICSFIMSVAGGWMLYQVVRCREVAKMHVRKNYNLLLRV